MPPLTKRRSNAVALVAGFVLAIHSSVVAQVASAGHVAQRYFVTDVGALPDRGSAASLWGINNFGQVTGSSGDTGVGNWKPFFWTPSTVNGVDGSLSPIDIPSSHYITDPAHGWMQAWGINDYGQVSGYGGQTFTQSTDGFLFTPTTRNGTTGTVQRVGLPPTVGPRGQLLYPQTDGFKLNNRGQVIGDTVYNGAAWVWSPSAANRTTGSAVMLGPSTGAFAINDAGAVGGINFLFRPSTPNATTGSFTALSGSIYNLNDSGLAVGSDAAGGAVWAINDGATTTITRIASFPSPAGAARVRALAANEAGIVVGDANRATGESYGYVWTAADGQLEFGSLLETHSGRGVTITGARDVNDQGQIAAKANIDLDGNPATTNDIAGRGVILTPLIAGDADIDQSVDFDDLLVLAKHFNATADQTWRTGDFTGEGVVDFDDLLLLAKHFNVNATLPAGGPSLAGAAGVADAGDVVLDDAFLAQFALAQSLVPEPATIGWLSGGLIVACRRRIGSQRS